MSEASVISLQKERYFTDKSHLFHTLSNLLRTYINKDHPILKLYAVLSVHSTDFCL